MQGNLTNLIVKHLESGWSQKEGEIFDYVSCSSPTLLSALYLAAFCVLYSSTEYMQSRLIPYLLSRRDGFVTSSNKKNNSDLTHISKILESRQKIFRSL